MFWPNFSKIDQSGGCCCFFSSRHHKSFENEKIFLCLKIAEIDTGVKFWSRRTILDIKRHIYKVKFSRTNCRIWWLVPVFWGNFVTSYLQNWKSYQTQILHQECFYGYNDSCKVSFQSVDVNLDFWHDVNLDFCPFPPGPGERLKRPGLIGSTKFNAISEIISRAHWYKLLIITLLSAD